MIDHEFLINGVSILTGDALSLLRTMKDDSIDCCVTSPPYWKHRDYGVSGQIGYGQTLSDYFASILAVCREVKRVLKPQGTFWLNIGDSYNNKKLMMVPNRIAILLAEDGWYVRSEIIWHKPNPMPESVKNRPTTAHEKVWLLTKSDKYFYDYDAIAEDGVGRERYFGSDNYSKRSGRNDAGLYNAEACVKRNARNVWSLAPTPFNGAHFATMPTTLAERCISAGCPKNGIVLDPFSGSGTTGLIAKQLGRKAILIELNPDYVCIAKNRLYAEDAVRAVLEGK